MCELLNIKQYFVITPWHHDSKHTGKKDFTVCPDEYVRKVGHLLANTSQKWSLLPGNFRWAFEKLIT